MASDTDCDIMVIGGGPAGLSATASIVRQHHKTILFDSGHYRNAKSAHMHTVPAHDHQDPQSFRDAARKDYERYGTVTVVASEIQTVVKKDDDTFEAKDQDGKVWTGKKVVLATGVEDVMPDMAGYEECWVSGIFHCLYCHGWEEKGSLSSGILAMGDLGAVMPALHVARQALCMSKTVTVYTNGNARLSQDLQEAVDSSTAPMKVDGRKIASVAKGPSRAQCILHFDDGSSATEAFLGHKPKFQLRGQLAQQLGLELTPQGTIKVAPPFNQTTVRGVFAAGDCASPMQTVTTAIQSGTCAGAGAPSQLQAEMYGQKSMF